MSPSTAISVGIGVVVFLVLSTISRKPEWVALIGWMTGVSIVSIYYKRKEKAAKR